MPDRHGPYRPIHFILEIDGIAKAGFSTCQLPASTTDVIDYREGNERSRTRKLAGLTRYSPLILKNGVTDASLELVDWRTLVEQGKLEEARRSIAVVLLDEEGSAGPRWELSQAWPRRYVGPDLDACGKGVAIETLEIVTEAFDRVE
ncbi:MAG: phage tail protein [Halobacteriales archaeon]|nr:phage tail protein [Halobacteriales archaeon]